MVDDAGVDTREDRSGDGLFSAIANKRNNIREQRRLNFIYRCVVGVVGTVVLLAGLVAIPYPGPGWLIVFAGLGILASEFAWAHRLLTFARGKYDAWLEWMKKQHWTVQALFGLFTFAIVLFSLWLFGALELAAGWVGIEWSWLPSPIL
jgi:uncharacterized protein (TIGR02611 family)